VPGSAQGVADLSDCPSTGSTEGRFERCILGAAAIRDGVAAWVASRGLTVAGLPREIYFTDFRSASPSDDVCDVALPIE